jgi:IS1 family transposase
VYRQIFYLGTCRKQVRNINTPFVLLNLCLYLEHNYLIWRSKRQRADPDGRAVYGMGLRTLVCWNCRFEFRRRHICLLWVLNVVQIEVFATGQSLVQRRRRECSESVIEKAYFFRGGPLGLLHHTIKKPKGKWRYIKRIETQFRDHETNREGNTDYSHSWFVFRTQTWYLILYLLNFLPPFHTNAGKVASTNIYGKKPRSSRLLFVLWGYKRQKSGIHSSSLGKLITTQRLKLRLKEQKVGRTRTELTKSYEEIKYQRRRRNKYRKTRTIKKKRNSK